MPDKNAWQEFFDKRFSEGALVTFVLHSVGSAMADESPQALATRIHVTEVDEAGDSPSIVFVDTDTDRQFFLDVEEVAPQEKGRLLLTLADAKSHHLIVSPNLTGEQKEIVKTRRKGMWGT